jgi:hypothetical protein
VSEIPTGDEYILDMIAEIDDPNLLAQIIVAATNRRTALARLGLNENTPDENKHEEFKRGDIVFFQRGISPKYLVGKTAVVTKVNDKSVVVNVPDDPSYRRFQGKRGVRCPKTIVSKRSV